MRPALLALLVAACTGEAPTPPRRTVPEVFTSFYPTTYFAERIGGSRIRVVCPVPSGADPALWRPTAAAIRGFQEADLIVLNGAGFERWTDWVSLPLASRVDTARVFEDELLRHGDAVVHSHGRTGAHAHTGLDGHTWLDPRLARVQADEIRRALTVLVPRHAREFQRNFAALATDLEALDTALKALEPETLWASHPAYAYLARRYGWKVVNIDPHDAGSVGSARSTTPARVCLWEEAPPQDAPLPGLVTHVVFSPCESRPADGDYLTVMRANVDRLRAALK